MKLVLWYFLLLPLCLTFLVTIFVATSKKRWLFGKFGILNYFEWKMVILHHEKHIWFFIYIYLKFLWTIVCYIVDYVVVLLNIHVMNESVALLLLIIVLNFKKCYWSSTRTKTLEDVSNSFSGSLPNTRKWVCYLENVFLKATHFPKSKQTKFSLSLCCLHRIIAVRALPDSVSVIASWCS